MRRLPSSSERARSRMRASPLSWPIGRAPARQSFTPLYSAGLWLAVNIAPGRSRLPEAKYSRSVEPRPTSITPAPPAWMPSANAAANPGEDSRMSRATTTVPAASLPSRSINTNAVPNARATSSCSSSGTTPRMSYALTMRSSESAAPVPPEAYRSAEPDSARYGIPVDRGSPTGPRARSGEEDVLALDRDRGRGQGVLLVGGEPVSRANHRAIHDRELAVVAR